MRRIVRCLGSIILLFFLPWLDSSRVRSARFRPIYKWFFWILLIDLALLGQVGALGADDQFEIFGLVFGFLSAKAVGQICTFYYFFHFLVLLPLLGKFETPLPLPSSIHESVLPKSARGGGPMPAGAATAKPMGKA